MTAKCRHSFQLPWSHLGHMDTAEVWVQKAHSARGWSPQEHLCVLPPESTEGGSGSWAQHGHNGRAHMPLTHTAVYGCGGLPARNTHTQAPPACMRCLSQQNTDWLHRYRGDKHSNRPSTHSKGSLSCRDREESSHHIWLGCIWVPAPQPRPGWDRRPDELCQLLSSSLMQTRRLTADPAPQRQVGHLAQAPRSSEATGREGVAVAEALRAKGTDTSDRCAGRRGQSLVRAQWAKSWC